MYLILRHKRFYMGVIVSILILGTIGCKKKVSFPQTYPVEVIVTNAGAPIEKATIFLDTATPMEWLAYGTTDATGIAKCKTKLLGTEIEGIPAGKYKVRIDQLYPANPNQKTPEEIAKMSMAEVSANDQKILEFQSKNKIIPLSLTSSSQTPLSLDVTESGAQLEVDISKYK